MAWSKEESKIPTSIGRIFIPLTDNDGVAANHIVTFNVEVLDQNGKVMEIRTGNLIPHLSSEWKATLIDFLGAMRAKANTDILPLP